MAMGISELVIMGVLGILLLGLPLAIVVAIAILSRRPRDLEPNPNLAPCPDCHKLVSIHASACPHCGRPAKLA